MDSRNLPPNEFKNELKEHRKLIRAIVRGDETEVRQIIKAGHKLRVKDERGRSALSHAAEHGRENIVKFLINETHLDRADHDFEHHSPVYYAAVNHHEGVVKLLLTRLIDNRGANDLVEYDNKSLPQLIESVWTMVSESDRFNLIDLLTLTDFRSDDIHDILNGIDCGWSGYIRVEWDIPDTLGITMPSQIGSEEALTKRKLSNFVTLTGSNGIFECSTCKEFLYKLGERL